MTEDFVCICLLTDGSRTRMIQMNKQSTIADLFKKIQNELKVGQDEKFSLIHQGTTLRDDDDEEANKTLESVGIKSLDAVNFCVLAPGGDAQKLKCMCGPERLFDHQSVL